MCKSLCVFFLMLFFSLKSFSTCDLGLSEKTEAKKYHYILVPGILNEVVPYYLTEYRRFLLDLGVPPEQITRINNSTLSRPLKSAERIAREVFKIQSHAVEKKEFVFFAHSKGALEALYFLYKNNKRLRLKKAFLIQGALDGASVYKMVVSDEKEGLLFDLGRSLRQWAAVKSYSDTMGFPIVRKNLKGLSQKKGLLSKITFIESDKDYDKLAFRFKLVGGFYNEFYKTPGDGVLLRSDHIPFELKGNTDICRFYYKVDHGDLVKAAPWEKTRVRRIESFLNELLFGFKRNQ